MKLSLKEKISYGLGAVGKDMVYMLSASYVLYYFQDVLGVSAVAMGIILLVARIFDAFNDPIMGIIVAKTRTKWGKFRPWLMIGTITNAVILFLMFAAPPSLDGPGMIAYAAVSYIMWGVTYTMMDIPYWSMIPAFTEGGKEREGLTTLARSCAGVGSALVTILAILTVHWVGGLAYNQVGATQQALDITGTEITVSGQFNDEPILILNGSGEQTISDNWVNLLTEYGYTNITVESYNADDNVNGLSDSDLKEIKSNTYVIYALTDAQKAELENNDKADENTFDNAGVEIRRFFPGAKTIHADSDSVSKIVPSTISTDGYTVIISAGEAPSSGAIETIGFKWVALVIAILFVVFITITCINIKEKSNVEMESPSISQMFKALLQNDQAMTIVIAIVLINCAVYITSNLVIYFFKYDFGGTDWAGAYTLFNTFGGGIQILSMMILYPTLRKKFSNIQLFYICLASAIIGYFSLFAIAFINMSNVYILFIPGFFIFAANGVLQVLTTVFLANTVEYGELKNGRRDESVIFSMQTFVVKLASGIAAFIASLCLSINNLSDNTDAVGAVATTSSRIGLRMTMTIIPIIGLFVALFFFKKKYILTDEKIEEISAEVKKMHAE